MFNLFYFVDRSDICKHELSTKKNKDDQKSSVEAVGDSFQNFELISSAFINMSGDNKSTCS